MKHLQKFESHTNTYRVNTNPFMMKEIALSHNLKLYQTLSRDSFFNKRMKLGSGYLISKEITEARWIFGIFGKNRNILNLLTGERSVDISEFRKKAIDAINEHQERVDFQWTKTRIATANEFITKLEQMSDHEIIKATTLDEISSYVAHDYFIVEMTSLSLKHKIELLDNGNYNNRLFNKIPFEAEDFLKAIGKKETEKKLSQEEIVSQEEIEKKVTQEEIDKDDFIQGIKNGMKYSGYDLDEIIKSLKE